ncbi:MAG: SRPBCC family protein [Verrucomicrobiae bacterium]|nr:SRPBCC family protein [Verrucomicrobiae bacterium]
MRCFLRTLAGLLILLIVVFVALYALAPAEVRVERSIVIDAPPEAIFPKVNDLKAWRTWSPWMLREPDMKSTYSGPETGLGAKTSWESETQGSGSQVITESVPNERIATALDFGGMGTATSDWSFAAEGDGTKVTWGMNTGPSKNPISRLFNLMMDKMVGPDYESGLANLKKEVEASKGG